MTRASITPYLRGRRLRRSAIALLLGSAVALATPAAAQLWEWTGPDGVSRYTNDPATIPPEFRDRARDVGSPVPRAQEPAALPRASTDPTVLPFSAGRPITAPAYVNGTLMTLMVDTGSDRTLISPAALARAGLDVTRAERVRILGITGGTEAPELTIERLDVAGTRLGPLTVVVHDVGVSDIDGLLGRDVLDRFTLTVDAGAGRALLVPR